jgi:hypothetical protein
MGSSNNNLLILLINSTMQIPLPFLFPSRHRKLHEHLQDAGVEYVMFYDPRDPNFKHHIEN